MRVVLSHPFSGALHWWLAAQSDAGGSQRDKRPTHPYYRTLYGNVDLNLDVALACSVVFEDVVLPAADAPYPQFEHGEGKVHHAALRMTAEWQPVMEAADLVEPRMKEVVDDPTVKAVLKGVPIEAQRQVLMYAATDILLAAAHEAPVLCGPGRRTIARRLVELGIVPIPSSVAKAIDEGGGLVAPIQVYQEVVSLRIASRTNKPTSSPSTSRDRRSCLERTWRIGSDCD